MKEKSYQYVWGALKDEEVSRMWNELAYYYSPQYNSSCILKSDRGEHIYAFIIKLESSVVFGGVFYRKVIEKTVLKFKYLEFGVPLAIQRSFLVHPDFNGSYNEEFHTVINEAFREICRSTSINKILFRGIVEQSFFGEISKNKYIFLKSSPMWYWINGGSIEEYLNKFSGKRRKSCRRLLKKQFELGLEVEVEDIENTDIEDIANLVVANYQKYGHNAAWNIHDYLLALQKAAEGRVKILKVKDSKETLSFEMITLTTGKNVEGEVTLTGSKDSNLGSFSLYDVLFLREVEWMSNNIESLTKCNIGQGCDYSKQKLGARREETIAVLWIKTPLLRFCGNLLSRFIYRLKKQREIKE